MPKVIPLSSFIKLHPNSSFDWIEEYVIDNQGNKILSALKNPKFGKVQRVVVCDDFENPIYDQYEIHEGNEFNGVFPESSGSIIIPYFKDKEKILAGIISVIRPILKDNKNKTQGNSISIEFPRGLSILNETSENSAIRELQEETLKKSLNLNYLGKINPNTAFFTTTGIPVYAALIDYLSNSNIIKDEKEIISKCEFIPVEDIKKKISSGEIYCSLTISSLMLFDIWITALSK